VGPQDPAWLVGFGLGGALALRLAVDDGRVQGLVCLGTAADLSGWAGLGASLVARCRATGVITDPAFPPDVAAWSAELAALRPVEAAAQLGARPLLVVHGVDDVDVPTADARALADAARGPVELRLVHGAGHWLRADPRVVAMLIGWIERRH
jgi:putative redox protein